MTIIAQEEGQSLLLHHQERAIECLRESKKVFTKGILHLNTIREDRLFSYGGYATFEEYLTAFREQNGFSRSLAFSDLKLIRLARGGMNLPVEKIQEIGIHNLRPFEPLIQTYNRVSGKIKALAPGVEEKLEDYAGETPGQKLGSFIIENVSEEDVVASVRGLIESELPYRTEYMYNKIFSEAGEWVNICWEARYPNGTEENGYSLADMPQHVREDIERRLRISE